MANKLKTDRSNTRRTLLRIHRDNTGHRANTLFTRGAESNLELLTMLADGLLCVSAPATILIARALEVYLEKLAGILCSDEVEAGAFEEREAVFQAAGRMDAFYKGRYGRLEEVNREKALEIADRLKVLETILKSVDRKEVKP